MLIVFAKYRQNAKNAVVTWKQSEFIIFCMCMSKKISFYADLDAAKKDDVYYSLTMFPYPSWSALHAGHASVFTLNDVVARYQRMQWKTVLNPFGFDSFGLPTENYAIKVGKTAQEVTKENAAYFLEQLGSMDLSFDEKRLLYTSDAEYYQWTQRIFSQLFKAGLVYRDTMYVNRCPDCQTVLANDQVVNGKCERCGAEIMQKKHPQWFIKITDYADRLIDDLALVDWPEETKTNQINWIGRKYGTEIDYEIDGHPGDYITVFTTRPDTNFGASFVVLAPDSDYVSQYMDSFPNKEEVQAYVKKSLAKTTVQRMQDAKHKTWVHTWLYVVNRLNNKKIPLYIADFVLANVGTGAVVGVPAHDPRDFDFATLMNLDVVRVVQSQEGDDTPIKKSEDVFTDEGIVMNSDFLNGLTTQEAKEKINDYLEQKGRGKKIVTYKLRDWSVSRQRYRGAPIPVYYDEHGEPQLIPDEELPVVLPLDLEEYKPTGKSPLEDHPTFSTYTHKNGKNYQRECDTLDTFMCSSFYFLRYIDPRNTQELGNPEWMNKALSVDFYSGGKEHTVWHLLYARFIHKFLYDQGFVAESEPFKKLFHQWMVMGADGRKMGKRYNNGVDPLEVAREYGSDVLKTYLMFMWPLDADKPWDYNSVRGVQKFLKRVETLLEWEKTDHNQLPNELISLMHKTIKGTQYDYEHLKFNTVVSKVMILVNKVYDCKVVSNELLLMIAQLLAPMATKVAEHIREKLEQEGSIHYSRFPDFDENKIAQEMLNLPVQFNGKMRGTIEASPWIQQDEVMSLLQNNEHFTKYFEGKEIKKIIYVQDKIVNIIVA